MSGAPIEDWYGVSVHPSGALILELNENGLTGNLPSDLDESPSIKSLHLYGNAITGLIQPIFLNA